MRVAGKYDRVDSARGSAANYWKRIPAMSCNFINRPQDTHLVGTASATAGQNQGRKWSGIGHGNEYTGFYTGWYTPGTSGKVINRILDKGI